MQITLRRSAPYKRPVVGGADRGERTKGRQAVGRQEVRFAVGGDHPQLVDELKRLVRLQRAYLHMNAGDLAMEKNDVEAANAEYMEARNFYKIFINNI